MEGALRCGRIRARMRRIKAQMCLSLEHLWNTSGTKPSHRSGIDMGTSIRYLVDLCATSGTPLAYFFTLVDIPQTSRRYRFFHLQLLHMFKRYLADVCYHLWNTSGTPLAEVYQRCDYFFSNSTTKHYFQQCAASQPCARPPRSAPNH